MNEDDILLLEKLALETNRKYPDNSDVRLLAKGLLSACSELRGTLKDNNSGKEYRAVFFGHEPESQRDLRLEKLKAYLKYFKITEGDVKRGDYYDSIEDLCDELDRETEEQFDEAIRFYIEINRRNFNYYKRKDAVAVEKRVYRENLAKTLGTHTEREWMTLCVLCRFACVKCGKEGKLTKDHVIPLYYEGHSSDSISNLQPLCFSCNCAKGSGTTDYVPKEVRESMSRGIF